MSVSSTSTSASSCDMSAIVNSWLPALFIVPTTAVSPSSMLRRVDDAVHGRRDDHLGQAVAGRGQAGLFLLDPLLAGLDLLLVRLEVRLAHAPARSPRARDPDGSSALPSRAAAAARGSGATSSRLARDCSTLAARPLQRATQPPPPRLAPLQLAFERSRVDLEQELAGLDPLALFDGEPRDAAHLVGRDVDLPFRLNLAGRPRRTLRGPVARSASTVTLSPVSRLYIQVCGDDGGADEDDAEDDETLFHGFS